MQLTHTSARTGYIWFRQGVGIFRRSPLIFITLFFTYLFVMRVISLPPVVGTAILMILIPGVSVGFLAASKEVLEGKPAFPTILLSGFRLHGSAAAKRLLILGATYFVAIGLVFAVSAIADGGTLAQLVLFGNTPSEDAVSGNAPDLAVIVSLLAYVPVAMLFWFAPVLVAWHDVPPHKALFFSWMACWRNKTAFVVYGVLWFSLTLLVSLGLTLLLQVAGAGTTGLLVIMPVSGVLTAALYASFYATYRGCFAVDGPALPPIANA